MGQVNMDKTNNKAYTERLLILSESKWKKFFNVQAPYRWNLRRLRLGYTLDIGCGIGRNLANLDGNGVGVDHNSASIDICRQRGFKAYESKEFFEVFARAHYFDTILLSHVVEHMTFDESVLLLQSYLPFLKSEGRIILIAPQKFGFLSDPTHVEFFDRFKLEILLQRVGFSAQISMSFPLPEIAGSIFKYNEFCVVGSKKDPV
jgi:SAM-dependent methyltransferase